LASPALNDGFTEMSSSEAPPETEPAAKVKVAAVQSELKTSRILPQGGVANTKRHLDAKGVDEGQPSASSRLPASRR